MSSAPLTVPAADRMAHLEGLLTACAELGHRLVRAAVEQVEAGTLPVATASKCYDRVTRAIRLSVMLIRKLAEPAKTTDRVAARKRIIREVEDNIQRHAAYPEDERLHEELLERLDTPDLEDEIGNRPIEDIITDIIRDLGLVTVLGDSPWLRRTPDDVARLCALAAQPVARAERTSPAFPPYTQPPGPSWPQPERPDPPWVPP